MKQRILATALAVAALTTAASAQAWTLFNSSGGDGYVVTAPGSFDLVGANNFVGDNYTLYTKKTAHGGVFNFNWTYTTNDIGGSAYDPGGDYLDGSYYQLSSAASDAGEVDVGSVTFFLNAGDTYGFYIHSIDSGFGPADIYVTGDVGTVPEPQSWALMLVGFGLAGYALRRRNGAAEAA